MDWDEREHPRHPAGSSKGGEFRTKVEEFAKSLANLGDARLRYLHDAVGSWDGTLEQLVHRVVDDLERGEDPTESGRALHRYMYDTNILDPGQQRIPPPWPDTSLPPPADLPLWQQRHQFLGGKPLKGWVEKLAPDNPYPNNHQGRMALRAKVEGNEPVYATQLAGGQTASTIRMQFKDGTSVVRKAFYGNIDDPEDPDEVWDEDLGEWVYDDSDDGLWFSEFQEGEAQAEQKASAVAEAIGAPALNVIADPDGERNVVWYGWVEGLDPGFGWGGGDEPALGEAAINTAVNSDEGLLIGLLDTLISNDDRNLYKNWLITPDGKPFAIDHGESFVSLEGATRAVAATGPFANRLGRWKESLHDSEWYDNPFHPDDLDLVETRMAKLVTDEILTEGEFKYMQRVLAELRPHATGTRRLVR